LKNFGLFDKDELVRLFSLLKISLSEEELHADLVELSIFFEDNSLVKLKVTLDIFSKDEKLVNLLLLHHKVLSGNNS